MKNNLDKEIINLTERFYDHVKLNPYEQVLRIDGENLTYQDLAEQITHFRNEFRHHKITAEMNVLLMIPMSKNLVILLLALMAEGCTPVLIDPRLGLSRVKKALKTESIKVIFSVPEFFKLKWIWPSLWFKKLFTLNQSALGVKHFKPQSSLQNVDFQMHHNHEAQINLITMTSGTTGEAKVIRRLFSVMKHQQLYSIKYLYPLTIDRHLAFYPISILQSLIQGAQTYYLREDHLDAFIQLCQTEGITRLSGPPQVLLNICQILEDSGLKILSLKHILLGGAAIPRWLVQRLKNNFPHARVQIMYGATECEPISACWDETYLKSSNSGYCLGQLLPELTAQWNFYGQIKSYKIEELVLSGDNVVHGTFKTGDLFYTDSAHQIWFVGRKSEAVDQIPIGLIEEPLEGLDHVKRVAFSKIKNQYYCFVETFENKSLSEPEIYEHFKFWGFDKVIIKHIAKIPVDIRHGWKIQRHLLVDLI